MHSTRFGKVRRLSGKLAGAVVGLAMLAACDDGPGPTAVGGLRVLGSSEATYVLKSIAGDPVPAIALHNEYTSYWILADTLRIRRDGSASQTTVAYYGNPSAAGPNTSESPVRMDLDLRYNLNGERVEVAIHCPIEALMLCLPAPHYTGTLSSSRIVLENVLGLRTPMVYERVRD